MKTTSPIHLKIDVKDMKTARGIASATGLKIIDILRLAIKRGLPLVKP